MRLSKRLHPSLFSVRITDFNLRFTSDAGRLLVNFSRASGDPSFASLPRLARFSVSSRMVELYSASREVINTSFELEAGQCARNEIMVCGLHLFCMYWNSSSHNICSSTCASPVPHLPLLLASRGWQAASPPNPTPPAPCNRPPCVESFSPWRSVSALQVPTISTLSPF